MTTRSPLFLLFVPLLALACAPAAGDVDDRPTDGMSGGRREREAEPVVVEPLSVGRIEDRVVVSAKVDARTRVQIVPRLANRVVTAIDVDEGDVVDAGDVLMRLYDEDLVLEERSAQASVEEAKRNVELISLRRAEEDQRVTRARREADKRAADLERQLELDADGLVTRQDIDDARLLAEQAADDLALARLAIDRIALDLELARIALEKAEITWERTQQDLEHTRVVTPIAGVVARRDVQIGEIVNSSSSAPAFEIVDVADLILRLQVPQDSFHAIRAGQPVRVRPITGGERVFDGRVRTVNRVLDRDTGTVPVLVDLEPDPALVPGLFAEASIVTDARTDALLVSKRAVLYEDDRPYVFTVVDEETVARLDFIAGASTPTTVEIVSDASGDRVDPERLVVVVGQGNLKDGDRVTIREDAF